MSENIDDAPRLNSQELYWVNIYTELTERYQKLDVMKAQPVQMVRLLTMRYGFSPVMEALVERGVAVIAVQARRELAIRQEFIARMMAMFPPDDPADYDEVAKDMAEELAAVDCPEGGMRLLKYLDRLRDREIAMNNRNTTVH